jgi:general L-amino acid transport system permease protein
VVTFFATGTPLDPDAPALSITDVGIRNINGGLQISPEFAAVLLGVSIYTGAFIAEIVRGSIQALPRGQNEAAAALGLSGYQRMTLIILPQALRIIIPPLTNQFLSLTKNSSLAVAIAYPEIIWVGTTIINNIGHAVPVFVLIFGTYLGLSLVISVVMNAFNRRVQLAGR